MVETPAIEMRDVTFGYGGPPVLMDVSFQIQPGEFVGIVGPNGGGKTTLLRLTLGLVEPTSGEVRVHGFAPGAVRNKLGYVPQHFAPDPQFPASALDVVLMGRLGMTRRFGPYTSEDRRRAREALTRVGLGDHGRRPFSDLSGGQRQRVLIARALVGEPQTLLLDEPTTGLDAAVEAQVLELLKELNSEVTIVLVTHDLTFVSEAVQYVLCVSEGRVVRHPTLALHDVTSQLLQSIYGSGMRAVRHDHRWPPGGSP